MIYLIIHETYLYHYHFPYIDDDNDNEKCLNTNFWTNNTEIVSKCWLQISILQSD